MSLMNVSPECPEEYMGNTLDPKYRRPKTNSDHIRSMTDQQLSKFLSRPWCDNHRFDSDCRRFKADCVACAADWLNQQYEEDT